MNSLGANWGCRLTREFLKATDVLNAHQLERSRTDIPAPGIVSVLVGPFERAQALFGIWLQGIQKKPVIPPSPDHGLITRLIDAQIRPSAALLTPENNRLVDFMSAAKNVAKHRPDIPIGVIVTPALAQKFLALAVSAAPEDVRRAFLGGFVPMDSDTDSALRGAMERGLPELYRSEHEQVLHKLMRRTPTIGDIFKVNYRYRILHAGKSFEIDFWCEDLQFALEVDGRQHAAKEQRLRDERRDKALAKRGIRTLRIHASAVITDPTRTIETVAGAIAKRRQELSS